MDEPLAEAAVVMGVKLRWLAAAAVCVAVSWFAAGELVRRARANRLPSSPDLVHASPAVRAAIDTAERAAQRDPTDPERVGELGMTYQANLARDAALHAYALAERLAPEDWRWPYYRGLVHEERGDQDGALAAFDRVIELAPQQGHAWFRLGEIHFKRNALDEAARAYQAAHDAPPASPFTMDGVQRGGGVPLAEYAAVGLSRVAVERGDRTSAGGASNTRARQSARSGYVPPVDPQVDAMVARSTHPDVLLKHAALAGRRGDPAWREFLARRALAVNPQGLDVLLEMASLHKDAGRLTEALVFLQQARTAAPDDHHVRVEEGQVLADLGRLDEAERVLRAAATVRDAAAEYNLALVFDRQDRWDEARTHYERALAINPFHTRALNNLGAGLGRRGAAREALALYDRAVKIAPEDAELLSNRGTTLLDMGRIEDGLQSLQHSVAVNPRSADARNNLGIALARLGRVAEAVTEFREALRLNENHAGARRNLEAVQHLAK